MSKHYKTQFNHLDRVKSNVLDVFSRARIYHLSHRQILDLIQTQIYGHNSYKRLTRYNRCYIQGRIDAERDYIWRNELTWCHRWRGEWHSARECKNLPDFSYKRFTDFYYRAESFGLKASVMIWSDTLTTNPRIYG